jgi:hypothetical protein
MLYQDHRGPSTKPAPASGEGPTLGSGRGATAFEWKKYLVYDQQRQNATMNGDVRVVHRPDANGGQPFNLQGQTLIAYLEPDPAAAAAAAAKKGPSTHPSALGDDAATRFRLRRVVCQDNVHVTSNRLNFDARQLTYDPVATLLTASGDDASPVVVFDNTNGTTTTASQLFWNTQTDQFKLTKTSGKVRR